MNPDLYIPKIVQQNREGGGLRATSVLMTLMGDVVVPRGGDIWLTELIDLAAPLGISERLVRTSVFRLREEGWLALERKGRRSRYHLTPSGVSSTQAAEKRIYHSPKSDWNGGWHIVFAGSELIPADLRTEFRNRMRWLGFGVVGPNVFAHPVASLKPVRSLLKELDLEQNVVIMRAKSVEHTAPDAARDMARQCCDLDALNQQYTAFNTRYRPLETSFEDSSATDLNCYCLRICIIHDFRRILLRDPTLPQALLPANWPGSEAQTLVAGLYQKIWMPSESWLDGLLGNHTESALERFQAA